MNICAISYKKRSSFSVLTKPKSTDLPETNTQIHPISIEDLPSLRACSAAIEADAGNAPLRQGLELASLADTVLVQVLPNFELGKGRIQVGDEAVCIAVKVFQGIKALGGKGVVCFEGINAKQLAAGVDGAVAIQVAHQQAVIGCRPTGTGFDAVGVMVEKYCAVGRDQFEAIAV